MRSSRVAGAQDAQHPPKSIKEAVVTRSGVGQGRSGGVDGGAEGGVDGRSGGAELAGPEGTALAAALVGAAPGTETRVEAGPLVAGCQV